MPSTDEDIDNLVSELGLSFDPIPESASVKEPDDIDNLVSELGLSFEPQVQLPSTSTAVEQYDEETDTFVNLSPQVPTGHVTAEANHLNGKDDPNIYALNEPSMDGAQEQDVNSVIEYLGGTGGLGDPTQLARGGAGGLISSSLRTIGIQLKQIGEVSETENITLLDLIKSPSRFSEFFFQNSPLTGGLPATIPATLRNRMAETGVSKKYIDAGNKMMALSDRILAKTNLGLDEGEKPTLLYNLGSGGSSLVTAIGTTVITKSPAAGASILGAIVQSEGYEKALEATGDPDKALNIAQAEMGVSVAIDMIGLGKILDIATKGSGVKRVVATTLAGGAVSGFEEVAQEGSVTLIENIAGIEDTSLDEAIQMVVQSFFFGNIIGGPTTVVMSEGVRRNREKLLNSPEFMEDFTEAVIDDISTAIETNNSILEDSLQDEPGTQTGRTAKSNREKVDELFKKASQGLNLDEVFVSESKRKAFEEKALETLHTKRQEKAKEVITSGRARLLESEEIRLISQVESLENELEAYTTEFISGFRDEGIASEVIETDQGFQELQGQVESARSDLDKVTGQLTNIRSSFPDQISGDILIESKAIDEDTREVLSDFKRAARLGEQSAKAKIKDTQKALLSAINSMPLNPEVASRLKNRVVNADSVFALDKEIDDVLRRGRASIIKETRKQQFSEMQSTIKKKAPKGRKKLKGKQNLEVSRMLKSMNRLTGIKGRIIKPEKMASTKKMMDAYSKELSNRQNDELDNSDETDLEVRYLGIMSEMIQNGQVDPFVLAEFNDDLNIIISDGERLNLSTRIDRKNRLEGAISKITGDIEVPGSDVGKRNLRTLRQHALQIGNFPIETYNTLLEKLELDGIPEFDLMENEIKKRDSILAVNEDMLDFTKSHPELDYSYLKSYNKDKIVIDTEYQVGHDRVVKEVDIADEDKSIALAKSYLKSVGHKPDAKIESKEDAIEAVNSVPKKKQAKKEVRRVKLNKGQAVQRYMALIQPDVFDGVTNIFGEMGYDSATVKEITDTMSQKDLDFVDKLLSVYDSYYDRVNEVYKRLFRIDMPRHEFYSPISRALDGEFEPQDMFGNLETLQLKDTSSVNIRTRNSKKLKDSNVHDVFRQYITDVEHWINFAEKTRDLKQILSNDNVKNKLSKDYGVDAYNNLVAHIDKYMKRRQLSGLGIIADQIKRKFISSNLFLKTSILAKQVSSFPALVDEIPITQLPISMARAAANPKKYYNILREHSSIRDRSKHFDNEFDVFTEKQRLGFIGDKSKLDDFMRANVSVGDVTAIYMGAAPYYDYLVNTKGVPHKQALDTVAKKVEATQQSNLPSNLSLMQKSDSDLVRAFNMFLSSPIALANAELKAIYKWRKSKKTIADNNQLMRSLFMLHVVIPTIFTYISSAASAEAEDYIAPILLGPLGSLPILGSGLERLAVSLLNNGFGTEIKKHPVKEVTLPIAEVVKEVEKSFNKINKEGVTMVEYVDAATDVADFFTDVPLNTMENQIGGLVDVYNGEEPEKGFLRIMGWTERTAEEATKEQ